MLLGALLLLGWFAQITGPTRAPWVWEDFHKVQGTYLGYYAYRGIRYVSVEGPAGILDLALDPTVTFQHLPMAGTLIEVAFTDEKHPKIITGSDLRVVKLPDPDREGDYTSTPRDW